MNKEQFINYINEEITHCNGEPKRAFIALRNDSVVCDATPADLFIFQCALDANLTHYAILFKKKQHTEKVFNRNYIYADNI